MSRINVSGFLFEDEEMAAQARKEEEGVRFIKEKSSFKSTDAVLKLYTTILKQRLFRTPVGLRFLMELQERLLASGMSEEDIPVLDVASFLPVKTPKKKEKKEKNYRQAFHVALFFAVVFGLSVAGMFAITEISGNNVNILNYENQLIDKYELWQQELEEKESSLREWEEKLKEADAQSAE